MNTAEVQPSIQEQTPELNRSDLLKKVNEANRELGKVETISLHDMQGIEGVETLRDKKILVVDDTAFWLGEFLPWLIVATNGKAEYVYNNNQSREELVEQILSKNPEAVLVDCNLYADGKLLMGYELVHDLLQKNPGLKCIAFATSKELIPEFIENGAVGSVTKAARPNKILEELAKIA